MNASIKINNLGKNYMRRPALGGVNLEIPPGKIVGIAGPNGSGKSTLLRSIAGLIRPNFGDIQVLGQKPSHVLRNQVAYLPDRIDPPGWMRVGDLLAYYQAHFPDYDAMRAVEFMELLELRPEWQLKHLSRGMQERAWLMATFCRRAKLYLLDEPLGGIDPVARRTVVDAVLALPRTDESLLISTHMVQEIERIFDMIVLIRNGQIVAVEDCEELRSRDNKSVQELYWEVFGHA